MPWWRVRTWGKDLETLTRLHRSLQALEAEPVAEQPPLSAPTLLAPPDELTALADRTAPPQDEVTEQHEGPELPPVSDKAGDPATGSDPPQPQSPAAPGAERTAAGPQPDAVPEQGPAGADPAIAAIKDTFRYVAEAGDKAVGFFYGQLFLRRPQLRHCSRLPWTSSGTGCSGPWPDRGEPVHARKMAAYLSQLGRDHRKYASRAGDVRGGGRGALATLRSFAGAAFTGEAEQAWTADLHGRIVADDQARPRRTPLGARPHGPPRRQVEHRADDIAVLIIAPDQPLPLHGGPARHCADPALAAGVAAVLHRAHAARRRPLSAAREGGSRWLGQHALVHHTAPGAELVLGPPLGTMTLAGAGDRDLLCVAGGTGLSPIKAIIEQAVRESSATPRRIYLCYGAKRRHELYDLPDLWRLQDAYSGFELIPVTSDDPAFEGMQGNVGRVAARYMPHTDCDAYVAGPPEMVRETIRVLARGGLERDRIHFDDALLADKPRASTGT